MVNNFIKENTVKANVLKGVVVGVIMSIFIRIIDILDYPKILYGIYLLLNVHIVIAYQLITTAWFPHILNFNIILNFIFQTVIFIFLSSLLFVFLGWILKSKYKILLLVILLIIWSIASFFLLAFLVISPTT